MPDFSRPEYVQLCRELRLEREFEVGDWYYYVPTDHERTVLNVVGGSDLYTGDLDRDVSKRATERAIWLPTLSDWLEMLEEAGVYHLAISEAGRAEDGDKGYVITDLGSDGGWSYDIFGPSNPAYPTREEAAARLWLAVTIPSPADPAPPPAAR